MKKIIGYTTRVFDLFHIEHLNILRNAKANCDYLIVGVIMDEKTFRLKNNYLIIPFKERIEIINSIKFVDEIYKEADSDKLITYNDLIFNILFKGANFNSQKITYYKHIYP